MLPYECAPKNFKMIKCRCPYRLFVMESNAFYSKLKRNICNIRPLSAKKQQKSTKKQWPLFIITFCIGAFGLAFIQNDHPSGHVWWVENEELVIYIRVFVLACASLVLAGIVILQGFQANQEVWPRIGWKKSMDQCINCVFSKGTFFQIVFVICGNSFLNNSVE